MNKMKNKADKNVLLICSDVQVDKCKGTIRKKKWEGGKFILKIEGKDTKYSFASHCKH